MALKTYLILSASAASSRRTHPRIRAALITFQRHHPTYLMLRSAQKGASRSTLYMDAACRNRSSYGDPGWRGAGLSLGRSSPAPCAEGSTTPVSIDTPPARAMARLTNWREQYGHS